MLFDIEYPLAPAPIPTHSTSSTSDKKQPLATFQPQPKINKIKIMDKPQAITIKDLQSPIHLPYIDPLPTTITEEDLKSLMNEINKL